MQTALCHSGLGPESIFEARTNKIDWRKKQSKDVIVIMVYEIERNQWREMVVWILRKTLPIRSKMNLSSKLALISIIGLMFTNNILASGASNTGIKVHGSWIVTVMNLDGSVAKEVFFQNSLVSWGPNILTHLLLGHYAVGKRADDSPAWNIGFGGPNILSDCTVLNGPEPIEFSPTNATVSQTDGKHFTLTTSLSLPASCISGENYDINRVFTRFQADGNYPPAPGFPPFSGIFSATDILAITGIQADQSVTFKVTFSFE